MTKKIYLENSYLREYKAKIIKKEKINNKIHVTLDRTIFCPQTIEGQPKDRGTLNGIDVVDVYERKGKIVHVLKDDIKSENVNMEIDWDTRFDYMQQHTGQHIISASLKRLYGKESVDTYLWKNSSYIDVDIFNFSIDDVKRIEKFSNSIIYSNFKIKGYNESNLRTIDIDGIDRFLCNGMHCSNTGEVGIIKIIDYKNHNNKSRLRFLCGSRVLTRIDELIKEVETLKSQI